ncbi:MAG: DUF3619 family protein [Burkholderiales bacterium]|jgi:hypothetical protein|nr:DUF3619 family protein [Burkholderiales bacterium]
MNELQFSRQIKARLDEGLALPAETLERLRATRERALARQKVRGVASGAVPAGAHAAARTGGPAQVLVRYILPALILVAALFGFNAWQQAQREALLAVDPEAEAAAQVDANVLKSDLPIDAYLDKGFQAWLQELAGSGEDSRASQ